MVRRRNVFVPALLAGNAVLYKPSEFASLTGARDRAPAATRAAFPQDVFIPLIGGGEVGAALLEQPVDGVFFTGSVRAPARRSPQAVRGRMVKLQLELGGKDPIYVCEDVDVAKAAAGIADGAFYNTGQSCCSVERIYVHAKVFEPLRRGLRGRGAKASSAATPPTTRPTSARSRARRS